MTESLSEQFDLVVRGAILPGQISADLGIQGDRIVAIARELPRSAREIDLQGRLVCGGLVETHLHLDKSRLIDRCGCGYRTLARAVEVVSDAKRQFSVEDIYHRAAATLETCIGHGTTHARAHVEVDPRIGLRGLEAMIALRRDYAWAVDLQLCVFPQEGLTNDPGCDALLSQALASGADLIGGAPYMDSAPDQQLSRIFALAQDFDVDIDLHLDFDLDPTGSQLDEVCRLTARQKWGGRVTLGHVTKLGMMAPRQRDPIIRRLAETGVAITTLPATDIFLLGRELGAQAPRALAPVHAMVAAGVKCSISTNNVLNPFTPYGDGSLLRLANLHAHVAQIDSKTDMDNSFAMISTMAASCINAVYGIDIGMPATFVAFDATSTEQAMRENSPALFGYRNGLRSFTHTPVKLHYPNLAMSSLRA